MRYSSEIFGDISGVLAGQARIYVRSGQVRLCQVGSGQVRLGQVRPGQARSGKVRSGTGQVRSC